MKRFTHFAIAAIALLSINSCSNPDARKISEFEGGTLYDDQGVKVVCLYGSWEQMGRQWGVLEKESIQNVLNFIDSKTLPNSNDGAKSTRAKAESFRQCAEMVYSHYPEYLKNFFEAAAVSSGFSLDRLKAANALEWGESFFMCSGIACWDSYSDGPLVYGRNYDALSYRALGSEVTVTVFHPEGNAQSFATIGYAGEIYCVNGFNESGLFVELNNGMASSGFDVDFNISLSTTELLRLIADAVSFDDVDAFFESTPSASGFLIGVSDGESARCYEWSGDTVHRSDNLTPDGLMIMTNHFTSPEWSFPDPTEYACWQSHSREGNLLAFAEGNKGRIDAAALRKFMRIPVSEGGCALEGCDMYQIVAIPSQRKIFLNVPGTGISWAGIDLSRYF